MSAIRAQSPDSNVTDDRTVHATDCGDRFGKEYLAAGRVAANENLGRLFWNLVPGAVGGYGQNEHGPSLAVMAHPKGPCQGESLGIA